jgi:DNA repair protein RadC
MHNFQNNLAAAELKFSYTNFSQVLRLDNPAQATDLLLALWNEQCQCKKPRRYVLFLNRKKQLIAWENLTMNLDEKYCAREIAGLALACSAKSVIFSCHRFDSIVPNDDDKDLVIDTFKLCETILVDVLDYFIITPTEHLSYKDWMITN